MYVYAHSFEHTHQTEGDNQSEQLTLQINISGIRISAMLQSISRMLSVSVCQKRERKMAEWHGNTSCISVTLLSGKHPF